MATAIGSVLDQVDAAWARPVLASKVIGRGLATEVRPLLWGRAVLALLDGAAGDQLDAWEFDDPGAAVVECALWDPRDEAEPHGWSRHPGTGRRRPGGDPGREFIRE